MKNLLGRIGAMFAWVYNLGIRLNDLVEKRFGKSFGLIFDFMKISEVFLILLLVGILGIVYLLLKLIGGSI
ncbi:hypothetical protein [Lentilactobacillus parakefiri]|uniref:Uncharacterized protein n=1 Tax=Lentilactobacillus parakefiri TaxID=152332 RepID=A0A269YHT0_9LACO|nr:hypothetical protein [Lentilactobacillus parakefiri]PAK85082.1 hypothetical protein B8W98_04285 [Lentilactobacillus parakefiri]PAL01022.1 hypothetical protein B8W96_03720 [Lentilactobacillus parakefiri]TDG93425.1 hypothetical protein C5L28_000336 [Lentilactobacillus parakefiri]GAW71069.1 hypothetical protein LPKJCM_00140 [Lentilactobacillus parakefiri]